MQTLPCDCARSPVADKDHDHIIIGNLKIKIIKLCKLFLKSRNYRENRIADYQKAKESIINRNKVKYSVLV